MAQPADQETVSLLRWLRRQLRQPTPERERLEAAVANDDPAEARRLLRAVPLRRRTTTTRRRPDRPLGGEPWDALRTRFSSGESSRDSRRSRLSRCGRVCRRRDVDRSGKECGGRCLRREAADLRLSRPTAEGDGRHLHLVAHRRPGVRRPGGRVVSRDRRTQRTAPRATGTADRLDQPDYLADVVSRIPVGHVGSTTDVAGAVIYLASPAASLVTGSVLVIDGGWTAR